MKRRLIVLRHAKSSWNSGAASDHERPLNKRGQRDAPRIAQALAERGWVPDLIVSSDSQRTRETMARMDDVMGDVETEFTRALYHAGLNEVRAELGSRNDVANVMVVGHNPGWEDMTSWLVGQYVEMTTCNAALIALEGETWAHALAQSGNGELVEILRPKELA